MAKFNLRALLVVLGAMLLISNNVANAEEGGSVTVEAVVSDNGEVVVESDADSINPADKEAEEKDPEDPKCPSRPHIIRCAAATLDKNKNNKLERKELQEGIDSLPWLSRGELLLGPFQQYLSIFYQKKLRDSSVVIRTHYMPTSSLFAFVRFKAS